MCSLKATFQFSVYFGGHFRYKKEKWFDAHCDKKDCLEKKDFSDKFGAIEEATRGIFTRTHIA